MKGSQTTSRHDRNKRSVPGSDQPAILERRVTSRECSDDVGARSRRLRASTLRRSCSIRFCREPISRAAHVSRLVPAFPIRQARSGALLALGLLAVLAYASTFAFQHEQASSGTTIPRQDGRRAAGAGPRPSHRRGARREQLQAIVRDANAHGLKVSISGSRHSQGGHTYVEGGIVLDMRAFNRVLAIDEAARRSRCRAAPPGPRCSARSRRRDWPSR